MPQATAWTKAWWGDRGMLATAQVILGHVAYQLKYVAHAALLLKQQQWLRCPLQVPTADAHQQLAARIDSSRHASTSRIAGDRTAQPAAHRRVAGHQPPAPAGARLVHRTATSQAPLEPADRQQQALMERTSSFKRKAASQVPSDRQQPGLLDHTGAPLEGNVGSARQRTASRTAAQPRVPPKLQGSTKQMTQRDWKVSMSQALSSVSGTWPGLQGCWLEALQASHSSALVDVQSCLYPELCPACQPHAYGSRCPCCCCPSSALLPGLPGNDYVSAGLLG